jgi:hypothetical protein
MALHDDDYDDYDGSNDDEQMLVIIGQVLLCPVPALFLDYLSNCSFLDPYDAFALPKSIQEIVDQYNS